MTGSANWAGGDTRRAEVVVVDAYAHGSYKACVIQDEEGERGRVTHLGKEGDRFYMWKRTGHLDPDSNGWFPTKPR